jgi:hypothetical protein
MSTPSYIAPNPEELFDQSSAEIKELISGAAVNTTTAILGKTYKIPVSSYVAFENIISYLLIGALEPEDAVRAIVDLLGLSQEDAVKLAGDLDKTILEKARISILGKSPKDMVTLTFQEGTRSPDELRKEILDTTKRESALVKVQTSTPQTSTPLTQAPPIVSPQVISAPQTPPVAPVTVQPIVQPTTAPTVETAQPPTRTSEVVAGTVAAAPVEQKKPVFAAGTRTQLLEQLQVLDAIPDDEEITARLKKIQEQITGMEVKDEHQLDSNIALQEFMPKDGDSGVIVASEKAATYSKAPTKYNVDPYREIAEES